MNTRKKLAFIFGALLFIALIPVWIYQTKVAKDTEDLEALLALKTDLIRVNTPARDQIITSPLEVSGEARGVWFFEASFPLRLLDEKRQEIAVTIATAQGPWMTEDFVPFKALLTFETDAKRGFLVFIKDNPSDLPEHDDAFFLPIRFQ
ncbi:MAG: Gmad2 immunoglobulin-like domain-containing protein [Candidatus Peregrinibacteria bacterium]